MNNKELDNVTEWEQLVNSPHAVGDSPAFMEEDAINQAERIYRNIRERRRSKCIINFIYCGIGAAIFGTLYCTNLLPAWIGLTAFCVLSCMAASFVGRLIEMNRR